MTTPGNPFTWGTGVRALRNIKGLTQVQLAAKAGVSQSKISELESGSRRISDAVRVRIAAALDAQPHLLFPYLADDGEQVSA